MRIHKTGRCI